MHVHLREPGREEDETIDTGTAAAVNGGFTSIACMPNTDPPIDTQGTVEFIRQTAAHKGHCNVFVVACVSQNREGKNWPRSASWSRPARSASATTAPRSTTPS